jgi:hypothetical protein
MTMRKKIRWLLRQIISVMLLVLLLAPFVKAQLRGEAEAVAAVERMLAATGGKKAWAAARSIQIEYHGWRVSPQALQVTERAWQDLRQPNQRFEWKGAGLDVVAVLTPARGGRVRAGVFQALSEQEHRNELNFWPRDFYTLFYRFAVGDPDLYVQMRAPKVVVRSNTQGELGWFEIDSAGAPVRWGTLNGGAPLEYVYGPLKSFGTVRFPAWGADLTGRWRFDYAKVELSAEALPDTLLALPKT